MTVARKLSLFGLVLSVAACGSAEVSTRNAPFGSLPDSTLSAPQGYQQITPTAAAAPETAISADARTALVPGQSPVSVNTITVRVPRSLKVSEANRYLPRGDIVWREDPIGDRYAQVQKIFQDALQTGVASLNGPVKVNLDVQVIRFHALTKKARYTTGGLHSITFDLAIKNPKTGELLAPIRTVRADLDGFGGQKALQAEARGLTQKVRISNHLSDVIRQELSNPDGYNNASLGFYQLLNNL